MVGVSVNIAGKMDKTTYDADSDNEADYATYHMNASDDLLDSYDTEVYKLTAGYTCIRKIKIPQNIQSGMLRVGFKHYLGTGTGHTRIYKNGVAYGTERTAPAAYGAEVKEDLQFAGGDYIELWYESDGSHNMYVKEFRVYGTPAAINHDTWEDSA